MAPDGGVIVVLGPISNSIQIPDLHPHSWVTKDAMAISNHNGLASSGKENTVYYFIYYLLFL